MWKCKCDCGSTVVVRGDHIKNGRIKSCGCIVKENNIKRNKRYNKYDLSGNCGIGYTFTTYEGINYFYFDLEDYDKIKNYCWSFSNNGYVYTKSNKKNLFLHRLIMNCPDDKEVDHIHHNTNDNRKENLRIVSRSQNSMNKKPINSFGINGIYFDKSRNNYYVYIKKDKIKHYLGRYQSFNDALYARREAEEKYFGEYSYANSIGEANAT